jgi:hypothetical protein
LTRGEFGDELYDRLVRSDRPEGMASIVVTNLPLSASTASVIYVIYGYGARWLALRMNRNVILGEKQMLFAYWAHNMHSWHGVRPLFTLAEVPTD